MKYWMSDGEEQKELEKLLRNKTLTGNERPSDVQAKYPKFAEFTSSVFRKHWGLTKKKMSNNWAEYRDEVFDEESNQTIPEIDGQSTSSIQSIPAHSSQTSNIRKAPTPSTSFQPLRKKIKLEVTTDAVNFSNPPILTTTYIDPTTKQTKAAIAIQLFPGVKGAQFDLIVENGEQFVVVEYNWGAAMSSNQMFCKTNGDWIFPEMHPLVVAFENSLMSYRSNIEDIPVGKLKIKLPIEVKIDPETWSKFFNKQSDNSIILFLVFVAKEDNYTVKKDQKMISFE